MVGGQREFVVRGDGENLIDFMYVDDAVDGFLALVAARGTRATVDFASGTPVSVNHVVQTMAQDPRRRRDGSPRRRGGRIHRVPIGRSPRCATRFGIKPARSFDDGLAAAQGVPGGHRPAGHEERMSGKQRVVVLGAGPAGMTAAWRLSELGLSGHRARTRRRRRRHGADDQRRQVRGRFRPAHVSHPRDRRRAATSSRRSGSSSAKTR